MKLPPLDALLTRKAASAVPRNVFGFVNPAPAPLPVPSPSMRALLLSLLLSVSAFAETIVIRKSIADAAHFNPNASLKERGKILQGHSFAIGGAGGIPDVVLKVVAIEAGVPLASVTTAPMSPRIISEQYSAGPNFSASSDSGIATVAMKTVATQPAKKEPSAAVASAAPACPLRAIW